jgi:hypothetical protein
MRSRSVLVDGHQRICPVTGMSRQDQVPKACPPPPPGAIAARNTAESNTAGYQEVRRMRECTTTAIRLSVPGLVGSFPDDRDTLRRVAWCPEIYGMSSQRLPRATAAGSFPSSGSGSGDSSVASRTMDAARLFRSRGRLRDRSGITPIVPQTAPCVVGVHRKMVDPLSSSWSSCALCQWEWQKTPSGAGSTPNSLTPQALWIRW